MEQHTLYVGLGSNLGNRKELLLKAIDKLNEYLGTVECVSQFMETEPVGFSSSHSFLNAACRVKTEATPQECLLITQEIEKELGRTKKSHNGIHYDRTIDIDLLLYDQLTIDEPDLKIPHPRMEEREFVMKPLAEVMV